MMTTLNTLYLSLFVFFCLYLSITLCVSQDDTSNGSIDEECVRHSFCPDHDYGPHSPYVPCENLPLDYLECEEPFDHKGNETARKEMGFGCSKFGGQKHEDVQLTARNCTVLASIQCFGPRTFMKDNFPCIKYTGHYFVTTLLYSILLGFLGMDRFILGHTGTAVGKLLTLGGVGIWWIVDIVLLVTGHLTPEDGSNWMTFA